MFLLSLYSNLLSADNDQIDVIGQAKIMLDHSKQANEVAMKNQEISHDAGQKSLDRQLKREEIASKEKIEKLKASTALKNKVPGEK